MSRRKKDGTFWPGFRPEARILLWVARICGDEERRETLLKIIEEEKVDWPYLLDLALHNRLLSLLHHRIQALKTDKVPSKIQKILEEEFRETSVKNMNMVRELLALLKLFKEHDIPVISYKGPILTQELFGHHGLRNYWDIDLIVHRKDVLKAKELVLARDYKRELEFTAKEEQHVLDRCCEFNFDREKDGIHLEVHWRLLPQTFTREFDSSYIWERAVSQSFMNMGILTLPPEEMLLLLCIHGGDKHLWKRLKWVSDVALLLEKHKDLDWERLIDDAGTLKKEETLALGLFLAHQLLDTPLPDKIKTWVLGLPGTRIWAGIVTGLLFKNPSGYPAFGEWRAYLDAFNGKNNVWLKDLLAYTHAVCQPEIGDETGVTFRLPVMWRIFGGLAYVLRFLKVLRYRGRGRR